MWESEIHRGSNRREQSFKPDPQTAWSEIWPACIKNSRDGTTAEVDSGLLNFYRRTWAEKTMQLHTGVASYGKWKMTQGESQEPLRVTLGRKSTDYGGRQWTACEELRPPANSHVGEKSWKWIFQHLSSLQMTAAPLIPWLQPELPNKLLLNSWRSHTVWDNKFLF